MLSALYNCSEKEVKHTIIFENIKFLNYMLRTIIEESCICRIEGRAKNAKVWCTEILRYDMTCMAHCYQLGDTKHKIYQKYFKIFTFNKFCLLH